MLQVPHVSCLHGRADGRRVSKAHTTVEEGGEFLGSIGAVESDVEGMRF